MRILNIKTDNLVPYANNPRMNDEAVAYVAESIKEFGFRNPIIIDRNNVVVCGHTRLKAAKALGIEKVPCIKADDLSDDQIKAFRIADNKVAEFSQWDFERLEMELEEIDIDMDAFGLEIPEPSADEDVDSWGDDGWYGDERERTNRAYNLDLVDHSILTNDFWQMPTIRNDHYIPDDLIGFNYAKTYKDKGVGVHFYVDDYQFERIWNSPEKYTDILSDYECILSPDFSLYMDMPMAMKIWNIYRSRQIGAYYQSRGIRVIPTISWAEPDTYEFCFRGVPEGSIVTVSTIGVKRDKDALRTWNDGMDAMIKTIKPEAILVYGGALNHDYRGIDVRYYDNKVTKNWKGD